MYRPLREGMPSYFPAMLSDNDRNVSYEAAIKAAIATFRTKQGRKPVVVDFGCGTGVLTIFALRHGAERVVSIDVNPDMADMCEYAVDLAREEEGASWGPCDVRVATSCDEPFDMIVSELFGTAGTSECLYEYISPTLARIRRFDEGIYCVPKHLEVTAGWYEVERLDITNIPLMVTLSGPLHWDGKGRCKIEPERYMHTRDGLHLHHLKPVPVSNLVTLSVEDYTTPAPTRERAPSPEFQLDQPLGPKSFLVLEWRAVLWDGVVLRNTLAEYSIRLSSNNAATRNTNWGLLCARPFDATCPGDRLETKVAWAAGVPTFDLIYS